jgi:hypothetical protein
MYWEWLFWQMEAAGRPIEELRFYLMVKEALYFLEDSMWEDGL